MNRSLAALAVVLLFASPSFAQQLLAKFTFSESFDGNMSVPVDDRLGFGFSVATGTVASFYANQKATDVGQTFLATPAEVASFDAKLAEPNPWIYASIKLPCDSYSCSGSYSGLVLNQPFVAGGVFTITPNASSNLEIYVPNPATWTLTSIERTVDAFSLQFTDMMGTNRVTHSGMQTIRFYGPGIPEPATCILLAIAAVVHTTIRRRQAATLGRDC